MSPPLTFTLALDAEQVAAAVADVVREQLELNREWLPTKLALSIAEAARALSISPSTAHRMARAGDLPILTIGTKRVIPIAALEEWMREHTEAPRALRVAS